MQELKLLGGEGNVTAALTAGTVANVAVVTLPSNPGYEYDVSIGVMLKLAGTGSRACAIIGGNSLAINVVGFAAGDIIPFPAIGSGGSAFSTDIISGSAGTSASPQQPIVGTDKRTFKAAPGQAITVPIISSAADTYYLHYSYVGRKIVNSSF